MIKKIPSPSSNIGWINLEEEYVTSYHISTQSFFSSYDCRVSSIASEAVSSAFQQSRWNIFLRAIASFTPSNLGEASSSFSLDAVGRCSETAAERESALVKNFSRYSFEMHSVKVRCERVKRENSGKKKADFPVVSLSLSLWHIETTS